MCSASFKQLALAVQDSPRMQNSKKLMRQKFDAHLQTMMLERFALFRACGITQIRPPSRAPHLTCLIHIHPRLLASPPISYLPIRHLRLHRHNRLNQVLHNLRARLLPNRLDLIKLLLRVLVCLLFGGFVA